MSQIKSVKSILRIASDQVELAERESNEQQHQIIYLSDKLNKVFHSLREFNTLHGRELHPEVLDAFNSAWRNYEASFDTWQSYQENNLNLNIDNDTEL